MAITIVQPGTKHFVDSTFCLSVDLGQSNDFTAICVMEHQVHTHVTVKGVVIKKWDVFVVRHLERLPIGISYVQQVEHIARLYGRPPLDGKCALVLDDTGVGRAVGDIFVEAGMRPVRVTITAGDTQTPKETGRWSVAKGRLVSLLDAKLHTQELKIVPGLAEAAALRDELKDFRRSVSAAGRFTFEARATKHDDLVLAVSLALWNFVGRTAPPTAVVSRATYLRK